MKVASQRVVEADPQALQLLLTARIEADIGQHWRSDERRIVLNRVKPYDFVLVPLRGTLRLQVGGLRCELTPGRCLAIAAGVEHRGELAPGCALLEAATIHGHLSAPAAPRLLQDFSTPVLPCVAAWRRDLVQAVALRQHDQVASNAWLANLLRRLVVDAVRAGVAFRPGAVNPLLVESVRLLEDQPDLTIAGVARRCGCSAARLRQLYAETFGQSPADYRSARRLREACRRLRSDDASIASIAEASGFGTLRAMQQAFRRHLATTPQGYREAGVG